MKIFHLPLLIALFLVGPSGCDDGVVKNTPTAGGDTHAGHDHDAHAHPTEGPHHGDLVELGDEEYHGEVVHDEDAGTVTIYVLDSSATKQFAIKATEIKINVSVGPEPMQFSLAASPDDSDAEGRSSRFVSSDAELIQLLDTKSITPMLALRIEGKSYRGRITHNHDHEGHDH